MTYRGGRAGRCGAAQATALGQIRSIAAMCAHSKDAPIAAAVPGLGKRANAPLDSD
jgi:hypothetical protein